MHRSSNGWSSTHFIPPLDSTFYLRVQGSTGSGLNSGSSSAIEATGQFYLNGNDGVFADGFE